MKSTATLKLMELKKFIVISLKELVVKKERAAQLRLTLNLMKTKTKWRNFRKNSKFMNTLTIANRKNISIIINVIILMKIMMDTSIMINAVMITNIKITTILMLMIMLMEIKSIKEDKVSV